MINIVSFLDHCGHIQHAANPCMCRQKQACVNVCGMINSGHFNFFSFIMDRGKWSFLLVHFSEILCTVLPGPLWFVAMWKIVLSPRPWLPVMGPNGCPMKRCLDDIVWIHDDWMLNCFPMPLAERSSSGDSDKVEWVSTLVSERAAGRSKSHLASVSKVWRQVPGHHRSFLFLNEK